MARESVRTTRLAHGITAVDTDYMRPLLDASHVIVEGDEAAIVDTGPNSAAPLILEALQRLGVEPGAVRYLFLTHVHLDHAGGAGLLLQSLPNARAVLHPRGARHMVDPARLEQGSIAVYGAERFRELYGDLVPIADNRIDVANEADTFALGSRTFEVLHTEGHARHHYCLHDPASSGVFTGDSFGISYREFDTAAGPFVYPTTTPVHFDPVEAHRAVDRIAALEPERLYLTHYSEVTGVPRLAAAMHRRLDDFVELAETHADDASRTERMQAAMYDCLLAALGRHGVTLGEAACRTLLSIDVELNVMGLEYWLDHRASRIQ